MSKRKIPDDAQIGKATLLDYFKPAKAEPRGIFRMKRDEINKHGADPSKTIIKTGHFSQSEAANYFLGPPSMWSVYYSCIVQKNPKVRERVGYMYPQKLPQKDILFHIFRIGDNKYCSPVEEIYWWNAQSDFIYYCHREDNF